MNTYQSENRHYLYFMHIEKTAGLSFSAMLEDIYPVETICPAYVWDELLQIPRERLSEYRLFRGHFADSLKHLIDNELNYVTILREPVARVLSHYKHAYRDTSYYPNSLIHSEQMGLTDFLTNRFTHVLSNNWQARSIIFEFPIHELNLQKSIFKEHARQYIDQIPLDIPDNELFDMAKEKLESFLVVGITEMFVETISLLLYSLNFPPQARTLHINTSQERSVISQSEKDAIIEHNLVDLKLYEFSRECLQKRMRLLLFDLLQADFLHNSRMSIEPLPIYYDFGQPLCGFGWHEREQSFDGSYFRWTGPETDAVLYFSVPMDIDIMLSFVVLNSLSTEILQSLQVRANDKPVHLSTTEHTYTGKIPSSTIDKNNNLVLRFSVECTISASDVNGGLDTRKLGVAIGNIVLESISNN